MNKGNVFVVSGPSGSGKDTLLRELFKKCPEIEFSISSTTRPMREEDKVDKKYDFISKEEFESMILANELLEYNIYVNNYYGTPKAPVVKAIENGKDMFIEVDVNGAAAIKEKLPQTISIFIMPPSLAELKKRLVGRGTDSEEIVNARLTAALDEIKRAFNYDYIVVNGDINEAVDNMISILNSCRLKTEQQKHIIEEVLERC